MERDYDPPADARARPRSEGTVQVRHSVETRACPQPGRGSDGTREGFALAHTVPLVEGRAREELRVLKLVLLHEEHFGEMARSLCDFARRSGTRRVALRIQGEYQTTYQRLVQMGARVRWTDLRMALANHEEQRPQRALVLSNWEI